MRSFGSAAGRPGLAGVAFLGALAASCTAGVSPNGPYACDEGQGCPSGYACANDRCVKMAGVDGGGGRVDARPGELPDAGVPGPCAGSVGPDGQCFESIAQTENFDRAQRECEDRGGYLATIADEDELEAFEEALAFGTAWIGLEGAGDDFDWVTGEPYEFESWMPGEPGSASGCAVATFIGWQLAPCNARLPFVCERP